MANHYHLLVETPKANLSLVMRQLNGIYTQSFNRRHKRVGHLFQGRFKAILVEMESYLLELYRYIVLNPVRVKVNTDSQVGAWEWSSYRATAGLTPAPGFLPTDWVLGSVIVNLSKRVWKIGRGRKLKGQIYLGSEEYIESHSPGNGELREIPRAQLKAVRPTLERIFAKSGKRAIIHAYKKHGYRLNEIAAHLGVHYATVSRRLKQSEQAK